MAAIIRRPLSLYRGLGRCLVARTQSTLAETDSDSLTVPVVTSLDMSAGLTDEQKEMQSMAQDFAMKELFPNMATWDRPGGDLPCACEKCSSPGVWSSVHQG